jgi:hypothetical protein
MCGIAALAGSAKNGVTTTLWSLSSQPSFVVLVVLGGAVRSLSATIYKGERSSA